MQNKSTYPEVLSDHPRPANSLRLKILPAGDRPREKMRQKGRREMSDAELLAILLGSGSIAENAMQLAQRLLSGYENDLSALSRASLSELCRFRGVGPAKACLIAAALELGQRKTQHLPPERPLIRTSHDAYQLLKPVMTDLRVEEFWIILLNRGNRYIGRERISIGGVAGTLVDPKVIFRHALENLASYIILGHNHPSGNLTASESDRSLTNRLLACGQDLDIQILDHLICTDTGYLSFADSGLLSSSA